MPIITPLEARTSDDHDARFIGLAAALKCYINHGMVDNEKMRGYVEQLCPNDIDLAAKAMYVAQWVGGR